MPGRMGLHSSPILLLHLRRLDRFLKRQGLHSAARALERESVVYFDAAHLQRLVRDGRWEAAGVYISSFSPLWDGERTGQQQHYTAFVQNVENHAMLHYLACRGDEGGRAASKLFCCDNDEFRAKFPEIAQRHDLYRSMASKEARESVNWEAIKLTTLEKLQELLDLCPNLECSLRMRQPRCTSTPSEMIPLGLRVSQRHRRKRVARKPARELALFLQRKRLAFSQETGHSGDSGRKRSRLKDNYCTGNAQQPFDPTECFKWPQTARDPDEENSA